MTVLRAIIIFTITVSALTFVAFFGRTPAFRCVGMTASLFFKLTPPETRPSASATAYWSTASPLRYVPSMFSSQMAALQVVVPAWATIS